MSCKAYFPVPFIYSTLHCTGIGMEWKSMDLYSMHVSGNIWFQPVKRQFGFSRSNLVLSCLRVRTFVDNSDAAAIDESPQESATPCCQNLI